MARVRSKSLVKKIAADIPSYQNERQDETKNAEQVKYKIVRSKSMTSCGIPKRHVIERTYPLSKSEFETLWMEHISDFNVGMVLSEESIDNIELLKNNDLLTFKENCERNKDKIELLVRDTDIVLESLGRLLSSYEKIWNETYEFDSESTKLIELQQSYSSKAQDIESYLKNYENLDFITKNLSAPGIKLVRRPLFQEILRRLGESIQFVDAHEDFKDIDFYKIKFRQCMTRSLTLIKDYLLNELRNLNALINAKLSKNVSLELLSYSGFSTYLEGSNFNSLINEIISRSLNHKEYIGLVNDVLNAYFKMRINLTRSYNLLSNNIDLVQFCQDKISFAKKLIEREFNLYKKLFGNGELPKFVSDRFYEFSKNLLDPFYDVLRENILKETNISKLCQLTTLLQKYYEFEENENEIDFGDLFHPILDDAQSRLIFRVQNYVDGKLKNYKPSLVDLKISNKRKSDTSVDLLDVDYPENLFKDVYLPLGKALTLLSNIYELINSVVFDDLAHYIVHSCILLLKNEFYKLSMAHLGPIDTKLNYLKQLIILKAQLNNFDIQYVRNDYSIDFLSGFNDIWNDIRNGHVSFNNNGLIELAKKSVPKLITNMIDANYEIEFELNNAINDLISSCINIICEPILVNSAASHPLETNAAFKNSLKERFPEFVKKIQLYIEDPNIRKFLSNNLINLIVISYDNFRITLDHKYNQSDSDLNELSEIMETDELIRFLEDLNESLQDTEPEPPQFNEEMLKDLVIENP
ncbi:uncharacterized protein PRCAT00000099001 [Priceomyces carsonii]|uniref:uncharacterized protein n=1 Tax=Priceomyces carsonii TaxID=28549 RepID=UPI002EDB616A|nr:unnamed protein product [Priceomyces carsonii]